MQFFTDPKQKKWNVFDLALVMLMIMECWILAAVKTNANLNQLALLRLLRLLRISRIFRMVPELGMMVKSMAAAARSVSSTLVLQVGIMYVFAIIFTQWAKAHDDPCFEKTEDGQCMATVFFGSIWKSLVTLMQILVFDDTFAVIRPVLHDSWFIGVLLMLFIVIASWTVLNMLIGIICEIVSTTTSDEKMKILESRVRDVFNSIDTDGSGTVTRQEFDEAAIQQLVKLGIDHELVHNAFNIIDVDGSGSFDVSEFLTMIFKLLNPPQSQDIQALHQKLHQLSQSMRVLPAPHMVTSRTQISVPASHGKPFNFGEEEDLENPAALLDLRNAAMQKCSNSGEPNPPQPLPSVPIRPATSDQTYLVQDESKMTHPFAPEVTGCGFNSRQVTRKSTESEVPEIPALENDISVQALEIEAELDQLVGKADKVEKALELLRTRTLGTGLHVENADEESPCESVDDEIVGGILKDVGLHSWLQILNSLTKKEFVVFLKGIEDL